MNKWDTPNDWHTVFGKGTNKANWEKDLIPGICAAITATLTAAGKAASKGSPNGGTPPAQQHQAKGQGKGQGKGKGKGKGPPRTLPTPSRDTWHCQACKWGNRYLDAEYCYNRNCKAPNPHYQKTPRNEAAKGNPSQSAEEQAKEKRDKRLRRVLGPFDPAKLDSQRNTTPEVMDVDSGEMLPPQENYATAKEKQNDLLSKLAVLRLNGYPAACLAAIEQELSTLQVPPETPNVEQMDAQLSKALSQRAEMSKKYTADKEADEANVVKAANHAKLAQDSLTNRQNEMAENNRLRNEAMEKANAEIHQLEEAREAPKKEEPQATGSLGLPPPTMALPPVAIGEAVVKDYIDAAPNEELKVFLQNALELYQAAYLQQQQSKSQNQAVSLEATDSLDEPLENAGGQQAAGENNPGESAPEPQGGAGGSARTDGEPDPKVQRTMPTTQIQR